MIKWEKIIHFEKKEFVDDVDKYCHPNLIVILDEFREVLGKPIYPSPVPGSCIRLEEQYLTSRHFAGNKLSDAIDIFCDETPLTVFRKAIGFKLWGGIGVYLDTKFKNKIWTMFHFDLRPNYLSMPVMWSRDGKYKTINNDNYNELKKILVTRER